MEPGRYSSQPFPNHHPGMPVYLPPASPVYPQNQHQSNPPFNAGIYNQNAQYYTGPPMIQNYAHNQSVSPAVHLQHLPPFYVAGHGSMSHNYPPRSHTPPSYPVGQDRTSPTSYSWSSAVTLPPPNGIGFVARSTSPVPQMSQPLNHHTSSTPGSQGSYSGARPGSYNNAGFVQVAKQHGINVQESVKTGATTHHNTQAKPDIDTIRKVNEEILKPDLKSVSRGFHILSEDTGATQSQRDSTLDSRTSSKDQMKLPVTEKKTEEEEQKALSKRKDLYEKKIHENCFWIPGDSDESESEDIWDSDPVEIKPSEDHVVADKEDFSTVDCHTNEVVYNDIGIGEHEFFAHCDITSSSTIGSSRGEFSDEEYGDDKPDQKYEHINNNENISTENKDNNSTAQEFEISNQDSELKDGNICHYLNIIEEAQVTKVKYLKSAIQTDADISMIASVLVKEAIAKGVVAFARGVHKAKDKGKQNLNTNSHKSVDYKEETAEEEEAAIIKLYSWGQKKNNAEPLTVNDRAAKEKDTENIESSVQSSQCILKHMEKEHQNGGIEVSNVIVLEPSLEKAEDLEKEYIKKKASVCDIQSPTNVQTNVNAFETCSTTRKGTDQLSCSTDIIVKHHLENTPSLNGSQCEIEIRNKTFIEVDVVDAVSETFAKPSTSNKPEDVEKAYFKHVASSHGISIQSPHDVEKGKSVQDKNSYVDPGQDYGNESYCQLKVNMTNCKPPETIKRRYQSDDSDYDSRKLRLNSVEQGYLRNSQSEDLSFDTVSLESSQGDAAEAFRLKASRCGIRIQYPKDVTSSVNSKFLDSESSRQKQKSTQKSLLPSLNTDIPEFRPRSKQRTKSPDWVIPGTLQQDTLECLNVSGTEKGNVVMRADAPDFTPGRSSRRMNVIAVEFEPQKPQYNNNSNSQTHNQTLCKGMQAQSSVGIQVSPIVVESSVGTKRLRFRDTGMATSNCDHRDVAINTEDTQEIKVKERIISPRPKYASKSTNTKRPKQRSVGVNIRINSPDIDAEEIEKNCGAKADEKNYLLEKIKSLQVEVMQYRKAEVVDRLTDMAHNLNQQIDGLLKICTQKEEKEMLENLLYVKQDHLTKLLHQAQVITQSTVSQIRSGWVLNELPDLKSQLDSSVWSQQKSSKTLMQDKLELESSFSNTSLQASPQSLNCSNNALPKKIDDVDPKSSSPVQWKRRHPSRNSGKNNEFRMEELIVLRSDHVVNQASINNEMMKLDDFDDDWCPAYAGNAKASGDGEQIKFDHGQLDHKEDTAETKDMEKIISVKMNNEYGEADLKLGSLYSDHNGNYSPIKKGLLGTIAKLDSIDSEEEELYCNETRQASENFVNHRLKSEEQEESEIAEVLSKAVNDGHTAEGTDKYDIKEKTSEHVEEFCGKTVDSSEWHATSETGAKDDFSRRGKLSDVKSMMGKVETPSVPLDDAICDLQTDNLPQNLPTFSRKEELVTPAQLESVLYQDAAVDNCAALMEVLPIQTVQALSVDQSPIMTNSPDDSLASELESGRGIPDMTAGVDPLLFQAVMTQLIQAYPEMTFNQQLLMNMTLQQTQLLQSYINVSPDSAPASAQAVDFNSFGNALDNTNTGFDNAENIKTSRIDGIEANDSEEQAEISVQKINSDITPKVKDVEISNSRKSFDIDGKHGVQSGNSVANHNPESSPQKSNQAKPPGLDILEDAFSFTPNGLNIAIEKTRTDKNDTSKIPDEQTVLSTSNPRKFPDPYMPINPVTVKELEYVPPQTTSYTQHANHPETGSVAYANGVIPKSDRTFKQSKAATTMSFLTKPEQPFSFDSTENWDDEIDEFSGATFTIPSTKKTPIRLSNRMEINPDTNKPEIKPVTLKPEINRDTNQPEIKPVALKPEIKPVTLKPEIKPVINKPEIKPVVNKPAIKSVTNKPDIKPVMTKLEVKPITNKPVIKPDRAAWKGQQELPLWGNSQSNATICDIPIPKQVQSVQSGDGDVADREEQHSLDEWCEVQSKRKRHTSKEHSSEIRQAPAPSAKQPMTTTRKIQKMSNFERLVGCMTKEFPNAERQEIIDAITNIRAIRGSLSGLSMESILEKAHVYIKSTMQPKTIPGLHISRPTQMMNVPPRFQAKRNKPQVSPVPAKASPVATPDIPEAHSSVQQEEEDICPICHEILSSEPVKELDCYHVFHSQCISQWVERERTCPTCRQLALFHEDFPRLGK